MQVNRIFKLSIALLFIIEAFTSGVFANENHLESFAQDTVPEPELISFDDVEFSTTDEQELLSFDDVEFSSAEDMESDSLGAEDGAPLESSSEESGRSLWAIFIAGFIGGFAALLMPCIFPMLPLTVSFFTKGSQSKSNAI